MLTLAHSACFCTRNNHSCLGAAASFMSNACLSCLVHLDFQSLVKLFASTLVLQRLAIQILAFWSCAVPGCLFQLDNSLLFVDKQGTLTSHGCAGRCECSSV